MANKHLLRAFVLMYTDSDPSNNITTKTFANYSLVDFPYTWNTADCAEIFKAGGTMFGGWHFMNDNYVVSGKGTNWTGSVLSECFNTTDGQAVKLSFDYATENDMTLTVTAISPAGREVIYDESPEISSSFKTLSLPFTAHGPTVIMITAKLANPLGYGTFMMNNINFMADVPDLACERIVSPSVGSIVAGTPTAVKAVFANMSGYDIVSPVFCYSYGDITVSEPYVGTVEAGGKIEYEFAAPLTVSRTGEGTLRVWLEAEADGNAANNAAEMALTFYEAVAFPYVNNFNADEAYAGWTIADGNGDGVTWTGGRIGDTDGALIYPRGTATAADYAFLPAIKMPAGRSRLTFYHLSQSGAACHVNVLMGTSPDVAAMRRISDIDFNNRGWLAAYSLIDIPEDGIYYFAFECTAAGGAIVIDNLYIDRGNDLCMNDVRFDTESGFNKTDTRVTLSYINHGVDPQKDIEVKYYVNYEPADSAIVAATVEPGDTLYYTFEKPCDISAADSTYSLIVEIKTPVGDDLQNDRIYGSTVSHYSNCHVPYTFDFDDVERCYKWATKTVSGDNTWFMAQSFQSYNGTNVLAHAGNSKGAAADDWTFSECIEVPAGRYELSFMYRTTMHWDGPKYEQNFAVKMGTDATPEAMTIDVADFENVTVKGLVYSKFNAVIDIPADGLYYIGFYNSSADNDGETYIDDLRFVPFTEGLSLPYEADFAAAADDWTLYNPRSHNWAYDAEADEMVMSRSEYYAGNEGTEGLLVSPRLHIEAGREAKVTFTYAAFADDEADGGDAAAGVDFALYAGEVNNPADMKIEKTWEASADYVTADYTIGKSDEARDIYLGVRTSHDVYNFAYTLKLKAFGVEYVGGSTGIASASSAAAPAISAAGSTR